MAVALAGLFGGLAAGGVFVDGGQLVAGVAGERAEFSAAGIEDLVLFARSGRGLRQPALAAERSTAVANDSLNAVSPAA